MKKYIVKIGKVELEIIQDDDGKFIKPYACREWRNFGTNLKPAFEPIIVARKPTNLTIAENCLKWGVGGLNIDECRIELEKDYKAPISSEQSANNQNERKGQTQCDLGKKSGSAGASENGRFPANVITDGSDEVAMGMPNNKSTTTNSPLLDIRNNNYGNSNKTLDIAYERGYNDEGSALRYFYSAKASKKDRDEGLDKFESISTGELQGGRKENSAGSIMVNKDGSKKLNPYAGGRAVKKNFHPTVKPVELMQYLVRLITPKGGVVLDIFNGSGSTGKAVAFENRERDANYKYIGIELNPEYIDISLSRIDYALNKYEYDLIKEENERKAKGEISIFDFTYDDEGE